MRERGDAYGAKPYKTLKGVLQRGAIESSYCRKLRPRENRRTLFSPANLTGSKITCSPRKTKRHRPIRPERTRPTTTPPVPRRPVDAAPGRPRRARPRRDASTASGRASAEASASMPTTLALRSREGKSTVHTPSPRRRADKTTTRYTASTGIGRTTKKIREIGRDVGTAEDR